MRNLRSDRKSTTGSGSAFSLVNLLVGVLAAVVVAAGLGATPVSADPAEDALAKLTELSRQAEQLTEAMHSAQLDLDAKVAAESAAQAKHVADQAALEAATAQLSSYQVAVDKLAASVYMGGRADGLNAILTAASPQGLIDTMAVQRVMGIEMAAQMQSYRTASAQAAALEAASAASAAEARTAAEQAAAVRADLQRKQSQVQVQIAVVKARYNMLTADQRAALATPPAPPPSLLAAPAAPEALPPADIAPLAAVTPPSAGSGAGAIAVQAALTRLGAPYSWGGGGPGAFDCSGLVQWSFRQAGINLPHSSQALAAGGQPVSMDQMQPGDVIAYYGDASHVGMYVGDGMMVHASTYGIPVAVVPVNNAPIYNVRRY